MANEHNEHEAPRHALTQQRTCARRRALVDVVDGRALRLSQSMASRASLALGLALNKYDSEKLPRSAGRRHRWRCVRPHQPRLRSSPHLQPTYGPRPPTKSSPTADESTTGVTRQTRAKPGRRPGARPGVFTGAASGVDARDSARACSDGRISRVETDVAQQQALPRTPWVALTSTEDVGSVGRARR
jgi:hypothetical protein